MAGFVDQDDQYEQPVHSYRREGVPPPTDAEWQLLAPEAKARAVLACYQFPPLTIGDADEFKRRYPSRFRYVSGDWVLYPPAIEDDLKQAERLFDRITIGGRSEHPHQLIFRACGEILSPAGKSLCLVPLVSWWAVKVKPKATPSDAASTDGPDTTGQLYSRPARPRRVALGRQTWDRSIERPGVLLVVGGGLVGLLIVVLGETGALAVIWKLMVSGP